MARRLIQGEIRLFQFRPPDKQRPVIVLTRQAALGYLSQATVAPITSTIRGVPSEVVLDESDGMKQRCAINFHHLTTVDAGRLGRRLAQVSPAKMREVCRSLAFALGCDRSLPPPS